MNSIKGDNSIYSTQSTMPRTFKGYLPSSTRYKMRKQKAQKKEQKIENTLNKILSILRDLKKEPFVVGENVWARWRESEYWFEAKIAEVIRKNLYRIKWNDGDKRCTHRSSINIRRTET